MSRKWENHEFEASLSYKRDSGCGGTCLKPNTQAAELEREPDQSELCSKSCFQNLGLRLSAQSYLSTFARLKVLSLAPILPIKQEKQKTIKALILPIKHPDLTIL